MGKVNLIELKIPNLGEAEETEIIEVNVTAGTIVEENDPLIVLESEKAAMEIPSDYSGKIIEIKVKEGQSVQEGQVYAVIESEEISRLSEDNHQINDLVEVPKTILDSIEVIAVKNIEEVLKVALTKPFKRVEWVEVDQITSKGKSKEELSTH